MEKLIGLIAATYTPLNSDGSINLDIIPAYQQRLISKGITGIFINGSTSDFSGLSTGDRLKIVEKWSSIKDSRLKYIVHVGHTNISEAVELSKHAKEKNMDAISTLAPYYFKPKNLDRLVEYCKLVAKEGQLPFYYYHIPGLTGVNFNMIDFLKMAEGEIPELAGIKYSKVDIIEFRKCLEYRGGKYDILFGSDENLLPAIAMGCKGAVGSTYNMIPDLYHRIFELSNSGNLDAASHLQSKSFKFVEIMAEIDFWGATKALLKRMDMDLGPVKIPHYNLNFKEVDSMLQKLKELDIEELKACGI